MKMNNGKMRMSLLALAVQSALLAMPVYADDAEVAALKKPVSFVELGAGNTPIASAKFGEYNGLNKQGGNVIGNFEVFGGDAYGEGNGTQRWSVIGTDLGTTSRSLGAAISNQGQWNFGIGYDELRHNLWDTYQTPYQGAMGGNTFTMPATFGAVRTDTPTATPSGTDNLTAAQKAALNPMDVYSSRQNATVSAGVILNPELEVKFDFNRLTQAGAKLMGVASMGLGTAGKALGEVVSILPNPTNYQTDTVNLALNWKGEKGHLTTSYMGSFFKEGYDRLTFQTFATNATSVNQTQTMSTMPSNTVHQLNLSGGYELASKTKLTGGVSYSRNTQNDAFAYDSIAMVNPSPTSSLNGEVRNTHADLKLMDQSIKDLALSASVKFDERNNKTASNFYYFYAVDGKNPGNFPNTPYSNRKTQWELAGDYRLTKDQHVKLAYNREDVKRWCDQYAVGAAVSSLTAGYTGLAAGISSFPAGTNCVVATASKDDKLSANYKLNASEDLNLNLGYSYSNRITDSDPNAITARMGLNGNVDLVNAAKTTAGGNTSIMGMNAGDFRGFYPFFNASRKEQMVKAGVNWQAIERMSLGLNARLTDDKYDSLYGVQNGNSWNVNLDATYSYSENISVTTYATKQHRQRELLDLQKASTQAAAAASATAIAIPAGATWTDNLKDDDMTVGVGAKHGGLMGGKLDVATDLTYSLGQTGYGTQLNYATTTTAASGSLTCSSAYILSCGDLPVIKNETVQFKLVGKYKLDKSSVVAVGYLFQQLKSNDYYYNGLQVGSTANTMMPTNQQAANYSINVVTASYSYLF